MEQGGTLAKKGWEITMHGCNHLYTQKSDKKDIFQYGGRSEFFGLNYDLQLKKIKDGLNEFKKILKLEVFLRPIIFMMKTH